MTELAVLLLVVGVLAGVAVATRGRPLPARLLLAGDSHAEGLEAPLRELVRARGSLLDALPVRGSSARDWRREHLARSFDRSPAKLILLVLGTNDCASAELELEFFANLRTLIERARAVGRQVILLVPPAPCDRVRRSLELAGAETFNPPPGLPLRGVHATPEGYRQWAASIMGTIFQT